MGQPIDQSEILSILQGFNPWWAGKPAGGPPFRRPAYDVCLARLQDVRVRRAVLLSGPRRVGKTTILTQIAEGLVKGGENPRSILYVSLDHPLLRGLALPAVLRLYHENVHPAGRRAYLLLDELEYSPDWELHVKQLVDRQSEYRILATGSASLAHAAALAESGAGRWLRVPVFTLSFYEFLRIRGEALAAVPEDLRPVDLFGKTAMELSAIGEALRPLMPSFLRYLMVGGFPETALLPEVSLCQRLLREDVVDRVLKRDIPFLQGIRRPGDLERVFLYLCLHTGGIFGVKACADALEVSPTTVSRYLEALESANLIYLLPPLPGGGKKVLRARHKVYLADAALRSAVLLRGEEMLANAQEMGTVVETSVLRHLRAYYYRDLTQIAYWRDSATEREVDMVVQTPSELVPVEVKYREGADWSDKEGLATYCRAQPATAAYLVTKQERDFRIVRPGEGAVPVLMIPAHIFAYLLGQAERLIWARD